MADRITERHMLDALRHRYRFLSANGAHVTPRYVLAEHVGNRPLGPTRIADMIVQDTWGNYGPEEQRHPLHGFEVKVSRSDWLKELRDPSKAEAFRPHVNHWWLVIVSDWFVKPGELPDGWGMMTLRGGRLTVKVEAPWSAAEPMPVGLRTGLLRAVAKTRQPGEETS